MEKIENNGPKVCHPKEREYKINDWSDKAAFEKFMISLGYHHTGVYLSDEGKTIIFY